MLLLEDIRESPGTTALAASWVLVFALMHLVQWDRPGQAPQGGLVGPLAISTVTSHRFGDMTWAEVRQGEAWRLVTATFIHFSLVHLALNLVGLVKLGRLIEPWYGPGPFVAVCLAIGGLGNLAGGLIRQVVANARPWLSTSAVARHWPGLLDRVAPGGTIGSANIHTGGGSTIVLGLLALGAVVGWRSRTRIGAFLRDQMLVLIGLTAVLGIAKHDLVDNYGHLGGAIVGAAFGFLHRPLIRLAEGRPFRRVAWAFAALVSAACLVAGVRADLVGSGRNRLLAEILIRGRVTETLRIDLDRLFVLYGRSIIRFENYPELDVFAIGDLLGRGPALSSPAKPAPEEVARDRAELAALLGRLDKMPVDLWGGPAAADLKRLRELGREALEGPQMYDRVYEFVVCWKAANKVLDGDLIRLNARLMELEKAGKGIR